MSSEKFNFLVAVHAFFIKDNQLLLLQRYNTGFRDGYFSIPAGHVDGGEKIASAVKREIFEETGVTIMDDSNPAHVMHRIVSETEERIDYFFIVDTWYGEPRNTEPEKCSMLLWADIDSLPENVIPYIRYAWKQIQEKKFFSEFNG